MPDKMAANESHDLYKIYQRHERYCSEQSPSVENLLMIVLEFSHRLELWMSGAPVSHENTEGCLDMFYYLCIYNNIYSASFDFFLCYLIP